jgi:hypothetical protein
VRRMRGLMLLGAAAVLLGGCETVSKLTAERPHSGWTLDEEGDGLRLSLGYPSSKKVQVTLTCQARSGRIDFTFVGRTGDPALLELRSGELIRHYAGAGHADPETPDTMLMEFPVGADDPLTLRVADTGELRIAYGDRRIILPNAFAPAHDFLRACRRPGDH